VFEVEKVWFVELFMVLCCILSLFGYECACVDCVMVELWCMGFVVDEDKIGNLFVCIFGCGERLILLCVHMDMVECDVLIEFVFVDGGWENEYDGIFGVDNKVVFVVIFEVVWCVIVEGLLVGIELLFIVFEEDSLVGVKVFDVMCLWFDFGYVFDHVMLIGEVIIVLLMVYWMDVDFYGKVVYVGISFEDGYSVVLVVVWVIAVMLFGRIDVEMIVNVGFVYGGVVVPFGVQVVF